LNDEFTGNSVPLFTMDDLFEVPADVLYTTQEDRLGIFYDLLASACRDLGLDQALPEIPEQAQSVWYHIIREKPGKLHSGLSHRVDT
jgi:hypothetical protein